MERGTHMIIVSILEARSISKDVSKCKDYILVEARFNNEVLVSDRVPLVNTNPELLTELCWELDRKSLHFFRKERKPIKLQCFLENEDQSDKHLVGFIVLDLREAQESKEPKFTWRPLLHSKYKGPSHSRPELLVSLQFVELEEAEEGGDTFSPHQCAGDSLPPVEEEEFNGPNNEPSSPDHRDHHDLDRSSELENDINVLLKDGYFHIWDAKEKTCSQCDRKLYLTVTILKSSNLHKLIKLPAKLKELILFHFKVNLFGASSRTNNFSDLRSTQTREEEVTFKLKVDHLSTLQTYFHLHSLEVQLCDNKDQLLGFVTINVAKMVNDRENLTKIEGSFQILPNDELIVNDEPYPVVDLIIGLKEGEPKSPSKGLGAAKKDLLRQISPLPQHFCLTVDIRSLVMKDTSFLPLHAFIRYSYPLLGGENNFQTSTIRANKLTKYIFDEGFCAFNIAISPQELAENFNQVPMTLELIEEAAKNKLLGVCTLNLASLFPNLAQEKEIKSSHVPVINSDGTSIGDVHVIFRLENFGLIDQNEASPSLLSSMNHNLRNVPIEGIDDLLMDAALELEMWKKQQLKLFEDDLRKREKKFVEDIERRLREREEDRETQLCAKMESITELEEKLRESLKEIDSRNQLLEERKKALDLEEEKLKQRLAKVDNEIAEAIKKISCTDEKESNDKVKELENTKKALEERIQNLEAKLNDKMGAIQDYEREYDDLIIKLTDTHGKKSKLHRDSNLKVDCKNTANSSPRHKVAPPSSRLTSSLKNTVKKSITNPVNQAKNSIDLECGNKAEALLMQIEKGRRELLRKGLSERHPIIKEIDAYLN